MIRLKEKIITINGFVSKTDANIVFMSTKPIDDIVEIFDSMKMAVEKLNILYEFKIRVEKIDTNKLAIKEIYQIESDSSFGILWAVEGNLIDTQTKKAKLINITKISGDNLLFNLREEEYIDEVGIYIVAVRFEDVTNIPITGRIIGKIRINKTTHYTFEFVDVREKYRDEVFRQIFRKQISLKRTLKG